MRVLVAGGSGVIGRRLIYQLVARGHQVSATTTDGGKLAALHQLGAVGRLMNGLDAWSVGEVVASARPDVVVNQMTACSSHHAGGSEGRAPGRSLTTTNRLRTEGADHLVTAAQAAGVSRIVTHSDVRVTAPFADGRVMTRNNRFDIMEDATATAHLEKLVLEAAGVVLRYGALYGPGATEGHLALLRRRMIPLVVAASGHTSWVHVDDAVSATVLAVEHGCTGVFDVIDDEPATVSEWLPHLAECAGAKPPPRLPGWLARLVASDTAVGMVTDGQVPCNARARQELRWTPRYPSWRQGFREGLI